MAKYNPVTEKRVAEAIKYAKTTPGVSLSKIAVKFVVLYDLFYRRFHGRPAGNTRGGHNKALNENQDNALKGYINFLIYINQDLNLATIQQAGNSILWASRTQQILGWDWSRN